MKKLWFFCYLALCAATVQAGNSEFHVTNKTGLAIDSLYLAPVASKRWGADLLGIYQLNDGEARSLPFDDLEHCRQTLKVVYADQTVAVWKGVDLCLTKDLELHYEKKSGRTSLGS